MNQLIVSGNLTKEPERYSTENGTNLTKFTVAVNDFETTIFINVVAFKNLAENCLKFLNKGSKVLVVGRLSINEYKTGEKHLMRPEIIANQVEFLSPKGQTESMNDLPFPEVKPAQKKLEVVQAEIIPDDLPF